MTLMENIHLFFGSTSIRGFSRIAKSPDKFVRNLWIIFVISTTSLLLVSIIKIIGIYLQYSVNIQTFQKLDDSSPFPAVTFCNHQPFSMNAYELWKNKKVMSPTDFNRKMRDGAKAYLEDVHRKNMTGGRADLYFSIGVAWDKISIYYQNLDYKDAMKLGHDRSMIHNCMWMYQQDMGFDDNCDDPMWIVKNYSHNSYFNCITIEASPKSRNQITQLGLILWLGPTEDYDIQHRQGFLFDIYQQAYGLRVVIHEPDYFPNIEKDGIQIEPGKMNEINYQATRFTRVNTIKHPCVENSTVRFRDLDNEYAYEPDLCLNAGLQKRIIDDCRCLYGYYPRIAYPSNDLPYCAKLDLNNLEDFFHRAICARRFLNNKAKIKMKLEESTCLRPCTQVGYESTVSVTKWRPTRWQLYWLPESYKRFDNYRNAKSDTEKLKYYESMLSYFSLNNLTNLNLKPAAKFKFDERHTYVVVKRKGNSTQIREERLVLTINALFSQIGGLCSLFIGLSLAFLVEVVEFLYIVCIKNASNGPVSPANETKGKEPCRQIFLKNDSPKHLCSAVDNVDPVTTPTEQNDAMPQTPLLDFKTSSWSKV